MWQIKVSALVMNIDMKDRSIHGTLTEFAADFDAPFLLLMFLQSHVRIAWTAPYDILTAIFESIKSIFLISGRL